MLKREPSKVTVARFRSCGSAAWSALKPRTNSARSTSTCSGILGAGTMSLARLQDFASGRFLSRARFRTRTGHAREAEPTGQAQVLRGRPLACPVITLADSWTWGCGPFQRVEWPHPRRPTGRELLSSRALDERRR